MAVEAELLGGALHVLETFLPVGAGTADPDLGVVLQQLLGILADGANDALERRCHVGEIGDTTADEEDLALVRDWCTEHKVQDGAGVVEGLRLGRGAGVLAELDVSTRLKGHQRRKAEIIYP